jgi:hypothetical protein
MCCVFSSSKVGGCIWKIWRTNLIGQNTFPTSEHRKLKCLYEFWYLHESWMPSIIILTAIVNSVCVYFNIYVCENRYQNGFFFCSKILNQEPTIKNSLSPEASDLICKFLVKNYRRRLGGGTTGAQAVKEHPFFKVSSLLHHISYVTVLSCVLSMVPCTIHTFWRFSVLFLKGFVLTFQ